MAYKGASLNYKIASQYYSSDEDFDMWMLINHVRYFLYRAREKELFRYGITPEQSMILHAVQALGEKAIISEIARFVILDRRSISSIVDRMEKKGFIKKLADQKRKNLVRVILTEKGLQAYNHSSKRESIRHIISGLSKEKREQLKTLLLDLHVAGRKELKLDSDETLLEDY